LIDNPHSPGEHSAPVYRQTDPSSVISPANWLPMSTIESLAHSVLEHPAMPRLTLPGLQPVACGVVRCGTSRAVIVDGRTVPAGDVRDQILWPLVAGESPADGLGGDHSQFNKSAEVFPGAEPSRFAFRFYQANRRERRLIADLECANVAAGAGLFAL